jgi:hypothetical protein
MRKADRLRELEIKVAQMEIYVNLMAISIENLLQKEQMNVESDLDSGKWYNVQD